MKPNTVCMGFYDDCPQDNSMPKALAKKSTKQKKSPADYDQVPVIFTFFFDPSCFSSSCLFRSTPNWLYQTAPAQMPQLPASLLPLPRYQSYFLHYCPCFDAWVTIAAPALTFFPRQMDAAFPPTRTSDESKTLSLTEYMDILFDVLKSQKNVLITRNFQNFDKHDLSGGKVERRWKLGGCFGWAT